MRLLLLALLGGAAAWAQCSYVVSPATYSAKAAGDAASVSVTTTNTCTWTYSTTASWLSFTFGPSKQQGSGNGSFGWAADRNPSGNPRTGVITVADKTVTITQVGQTCSTSAVGNTSATVGVTGGTGVFQIKTNCTWTAATTASWLTVSGAGDVDGNINFTAAANPCATDRTATVTAGGLSYQVLQSGSDNNLTLTPTSATVANTGGEGAFRVNTGTGCGYTATSNTSWLTVLSSIGGTISYRAAANTGTQSRTGVIAVAPKTFTVTQPAATPAPMRITAVVNSANYAAPPLAPGEVVTIYGEQFGPADVVPAQLTSDGRSLTKILGNTRVLFDGVPAAMIYAVAGQVSAVVPYGVAGQNTTAVQVEYNGTRSTAFSATVGASSPAIFTMDQSGTDGGAILNQDYTVNTAATPAARGSVIFIYCTGAGVTLPASVDAALTSTPLPLVSLPVSVTIGGVDAKIYYAGGAPDAIAGLTQINAEIPAGVIPGDKVAVKIRIGDKDSTDGVTVAVK